MYEPQDFADNYVDKSFLTGLRRNQNARRYTFSGLVVDSMVISHQVSMAAQFLAVFELVYAGLLAVRVLAAIQLVFSAAGWALLSRHYASQLWPSVRSFILLTSLLVMASPILRTLTDPISDDTIWAFAISLLLVHLVCYEYRPFRQVQVYFSPISLNAAVFASVVLASRLPDLVTVFTFLYYSLTLFMASPLIRHHLHLRLSRSVAPSLFLFAFTAAIVWLSSGLALLIYLAILIFVTFICPFLLIYMQKYKNEINGPWDEAELQDPQKKKI